MNTDYGAKNLPLEDTQRFRVDPVQHTIALVAYLIGVLLVQYSRSVFSVRLGRNFEHQTALGIDNNWLTAILHFPPFLV